MKAILLISLLITTPAYSQQAVEVVSNLDRAPASNPQQGGTVAPPVSKLKKGSLSLNPKKYKIEFSKGKKYKTKEDANTYYVYKLFVNSVERAKIYTNGKPIISEIMGTFQDATINNENIILHLNEMKKYNNYANRVKAQSKRDTTDIFLNQFIDAVDAPATVDMAQQAAKDKELLSLKQELDFLKNNLQSCQTQLAQSSSLPNNAPPPPSPVISSWEKELVDNIVFFMQNKDRPKVGSQQGQIQVPINQKQISNQARPQYNNNGNYQRQPAQQRAAASANPQYNQNGSIPAPNNYQQQNYQQQNNRPINNVQQAPAQSQAGQTNWTVP
jgi:hypothetical protein